MDSDVGRPPSSRRTDETAQATSTTATDACEASKSWGARNDFAFEDNPAGGAFAHALNALVRANDSPTIAVSSHMDAHCVWMVAFSAPESAGAPSPQHVTTFTPMLRHPAGLWTAAPQATGWLRVVDRSARTVWIPIVNATGSATYGETSCASLSAVRVSATIPASAAGLSLVTAQGERTIAELMGPEIAPRGWAVSFRFSADSSR